MEIFPILSRLLQKPNQTNYKIVDQFDPLIIDKLDVFKINLGKDNRSYFNNGGYYIKSLQTVSINSQLINVDFFSSFSTSNLLRPTEKPFIEGGGIKTNLVNLGIIKKKSSVMRDEFTTNNYYNLSSVSWTNNQNTITFSEVSDTSKNYKFTSNNFPTPGTTSYWVPNGILSWNGYSDESLTNPLSPSSFTINSAGFLYNNVQYNYNESTAIGKSILLLRVL